MRFLENLGPQAKVYKLAKQIEISSQFTLLPNEKPSSVSGLVLKAEMTAEDHYSP